MDLDPGRPPVTLLGLRLSQPSRERADRQWREVLGGECAEGTASTLTYRWPASPLRIVVDIDPARDEGPVCLEIASDRAIVLAPDQRARLGVVVREAPATSSPPRR